MEPGSPHIHGLQRVGTSEAVKAVATLLRLIGGDTLRDDISLAVEQAIEAGVDDEEILALVRHAF